MTLTPTTIAEVQEAVHTLSLLHPHGGRTKPALAAAPSEAAQVDLTSLAGILEYEPAEYTFTAFAGTSVADVAAVLAEHGQYLPFEPSFTAQGATLGGTIASGLSGSARFRYGGVRDFIIGIRFVNGLGQVVLGGGKVVKNAAGFDLPKLMVGSMGRLGILAEVSFKVFPEPRTYLTISRTYPSAAEAVTMINQLNVRPFDIEALDIAVDAETPIAKLMVRIGGVASVLHERAQRIQKLLGESALIEGVEEGALWIHARDFGWLPTDAALVKVPLTPGKLVRLDERLTAASAERRYSGGGNVGWIAWPHEIDHLHKLLQELELGGLVLIDSRNPDSLLIGQSVGGILLERVKSVLDPAQKFLPFQSG